jgi:hypothetical protein
MMRRTCPPPRRSPVHLGLAVVISALAFASVTACESEDPECTKDSECQEITCGDGSKLQGCEDGACLQGTDCEQEADGGW